MIKMTAYDLESVGKRKQDCDQISAMAFQRFPVNAGEA